MIYLSYFIIFLVINNFCTTFADGSYFELELLQVLFRHGDRTPNENEVPLNNRNNLIFQEIGYGQLTKLGKQREYKIGQVLRAHYSDFLGEYDVGDVYARSTDEDRTKMSLQLILAGLYPPTNKTRWSNDINWTPIPTHYEPAGIDFLHFTKCPKFIKMFLERSATVDRTIDNNFYNYLVSNNPELSPPIMVISRLYAYLSTFSSLDLPLPNWCSKDDFEKLKQYAGTYYSMMTNTTLMKKVTVDATIEQFLKNIENHENNKGPKKIYLYSAHDANVVTFTSIHNFTGIPALPDFGSSVIVEKLKGSDNQTYIRMFLWTGTSENWIPLKLENCDYACPLSEYRKLINWILPDEESRRLCYDADAYCEGLKH